CRVRRSDRTKRRRRVRRLRSGLAGWSHARSRRSTAAGLRLAAVLTLTLLVVAPCGSTSSSGSGPSTRTAPVGPGADADVASGCWKASDRTTSAAGSYRQWKTPPAMVIDVAKHYTATLTTNKGAFTVEFFPGDAPKTVDNFICLAKAGYYDGTPFHRIV